MRNSEKAGCPKRHQRFRRAFRVVILASSLLAAPLGPALAEAAPDALTLGAGDKLRVVVFGRPDLSGEFKVQAPGVVTLPVLGSFEAAGIDAGTFQQRILDRLAELGIGRTSVSVDIAEYRPVYVLGTVRQPGSIPYVADMTVLHALALAAGASATPSDELGAFVAAVRARENIDILTSALSSALLRRARLQAELYDRNTVELPPELAAMGDRAWIERLLGMENELFANRRAQISGQEAALRRQMEHYQSEIAALTGQGQALDEQRRLLDIELVDLKSLVSRGLAPKPRLLELQRTAADIDGDALQIRAYIARAHQRISAIEQEINDVRSRHRAEVLEELRKVESEIVDIGHKRNGAEVVWRLTETAAASANLGASRPAGYNYEILRKADSELQSLNADETTSLLPGDILRVTLKEEGGVSRQGQMFSSSRHPDASDVKSR